jgi:Zn finger protein HypA/HybF involved in hydrogenase expression
MSTFDPDKMYALLTGSTWTTCQMCGDATQPLDMDGNCPACASDMQVDQTERNG